jgi:hypothetical protein
VVSETSIVQSPVVLIGGVGGGGGAGGDGGGRGRVQDDAVISASALSKWRHIDEAVPALPLAQVPEIQSLELARSTSIART